VSDVPMDPNADGQPSEEEVRAYLGQLRAAPADQVLAEVFSGLLNAAQVKVGRRDARLLLDATATLVAEVRPVLPQELVTQLDDVLSQLRMAQVQAEPEVAQAAAQGQVEPNDLGADAAAGSEQAPSGEGDAAASGGQPPAGGTKPSTGSDAASRLWVPGR
jgi:hypothetical protein